MHKMFFVKITPEEFDNRTITSDFGFVFISFEKVRFQNDVIFVHRKPQSRRFVKIRFRDDLVCSVGLTV